MKPSAKIDAALVTLAGAFGKALQPGEITGTLVDQDGEFEVEVVLRVRRRVSMTQTARLRARAMAVFQLERYYDHCPRSVANRSPWRTSTSKTTCCSGKVSAAIVRRIREWEDGPLQPGEARRLVDGERFEFVCSRHADANEADVLAVVRLEQSHLRTIRSKRARQDDEARARERAKERALEAELPTLSDDVLAARLADAIAAHEWGVEDACLREQRRRRNLPPNSAGGRSIRLISGGS